MHKLLCITGGKQYDITPLVGGLAWTSSMDTLGVQLDFNVAYNDDPLFPINPITLGSMVVLTGDNGEVFRGFVVTEEKQGRSGTSYNAFDGCFYLNKSKGVYKFKNIRSDAAIKQILGNFNIPIGTILPITTVLSQIYIEKTLAEIIKDILERAKGEIGDKLIMEMKAGKLNIFKRGAMFVTGEYTLATGTAPVDVAQVIGDATKKRSIDGMYNIVKIISDDHVVGEARDAGLISQYGKLQEVQSIDGKDKAQAMNTAKNLLKDLGKISEENSLELLGDDRFRAGRMFTVSEPITGITGTYLIKEVRHADNGIHTMSLTLGVV